MKGAAFITRHGLLSPPLAGERWRGGVIREHAGNTASSLTLPRKRERGQAVIAWTAS